MSASGPWRTSGEWWRGGAGEAGRAGTESREVRSDPPNLPNQPHLPNGPPHSGWDRDEWDVALNDGGAYRIFLDRSTGGWFIDAICD
jgi:hypothetical protein